MIAVTLTLSEFLLARIVRTTETVAPYDPSRVLAECEAKRQIIDYVHTINGALDVAYPTGERGRWVIEEKVLGRMAAVYADHPDYRQEWRP
jgi:hypothetical protein